ncbi:type II secretion system F family protein [Mariluticola halotolerans]|uniref:type II secretion system F family protein n=1 Tax=Mariluticola halotolerans TaxID=2909283 RepID=UPI0026E49497|nr:type II secretion system F family protein [Mariluticola halotolerans]UJQ93159.1 type II secretion system F family protein [Mariluticola halotolerans]
MNFIELLTSRDFLMAMLAAVSVAAIVFTLGAQFTDRSAMRNRIKRVALERERMRAEEMARLRASSEKKGSIRAGSESKTYMKAVVDKFSLQKAFADEGTLENLQRAGYRGKGPLTTFLFMRFVTPFVMFLISLIYLSLTYLKDQPLYMSFAYAVGIGILGSYLPVILLRNRITKRQQSIRRAWSDCLDLMLLCVESGMSIEHAFKRVAKEIGEQSVELAEELTLTTAELSFLEDRTRAYENLGKRTGLDGVRSVMTALIQADKYGTSVGQALRVMAAEGREARMMEAEKKAGALPPKLTVPLIVFFLPVLFIVIMAPAMLKIFGPGGTLAGG